MVNRDRLWEHLMELGEVGKEGSGGVTRFSFTPMEQKAKSIVSRYMVEAGLEVREDAIGNLIGRYNSKNLQLPTVVVGSHIDTVPSGGKFDGALGVLGGIEALHTMHEQNISVDHPIEVIAFTDEEGARFHFGMIGSRAFAGTLTSNDLLSMDKDGTTIHEAMQLYGLQPEQLSTCARPQKDIKAYLELHIEQGKVLESKYLSIGIVSGIAGPLWLNFTIVGEAGHAGSTPMAFRADALQGAVEIIHMMQQRVLKEKITVGTVGQLTILPGAVNIIPGEVRFTLDLREIDENIRNVVEGDIRTQAHAICEEHGLHLEIVDLQRVAPAQCSPKIQSVIDTVCNKRNIGRMRLMSGAGHDGMQFARLCPIGMIFVPSKNGISHNPSEFSSPDDCAIGAEVLNHTLLELSMKETLL